MSFGFSELGQKTVLALAVKALAIGVLFLLNIIVSRTLGVDEAGMFFLVQTVVMIAVAISRLGFDNVIVKVFSRYHSKGESWRIWALYKNVLATIFVSSSVIAIIIFALRVLIGSAIFSNELLEVVLVVAAPCIILLNIITYHAFCFQGLKFIFERVVFESLAHSSVFLLAILLLKPTTALELFTVYLYALLATLIVAMLRWFNVARLNINLSCYTLHNSYKADFLSALASAKIMLSVVVTTQIVHWSSVIIIGIYSAPSDVAIFFASLKTASLISFVLVAINAAAAPTFAALYGHGDITSIDRLALRISRATFLFTAPLLTLVMLWADEIILLFGSDFIEGGDVLRVLALGQFVNAATGPVGYILQMTDGEAAMRKGVLVGAVVAIIGGLTLIPLYGILGAAIVTTCAVTTQNLLCVWFVRQSLGFNALYLWRKI
ncbi:MAG: polysaccharide biosynthesis C-terminal domain-containing protein [Pseudomonadales bacterium]|jgi:O-antigen/teichoic acid export membrane protein